MPKLWRTCIQHLLDICVFGHLCVVVHQAGFGLSSFSLQWLPWGCGLDLCWKHWDVLVIPERGLQSLFCFSPLSGNWGVWGSTRSCVGIQTQLGQLTKGIFQIVGQWLSPMELGEGGGSGGCWSDNFHLHKNHLLFSQVHYGTHKLYFKV